MKLRSLILVLMAVAMLPALVFSQEKKGEMAALASDAELVETRTAAPHLKEAAAYVVKDNTITVELSEYAGYSGLIVANGGMDPSEDSLFFKKHHFKVKLSLSEEEASGRLNHGEMAASATTADVLPVYGKQYQVVVPAQIGFSRGADGIVVRSEIKRINDLKGKVLSCCQFTESDFFIRYLAQEAGMAVNMLPDLKTLPDPDKVNLVYCADGFGAGDLFARDLKEGRTRLAGCVTWAPKTNEVAEGSNGKAHVLVTNRNLLIVADILIVNKGFADNNPEMVRGLVEEMIAGNQMARDNPDAQLKVICQAFKWDKDKAKAELAKVHLANLPENLAFFDGTIDSAGSFGFIYESAVSCYGKELIPNPAPSEHFVNVTALQDMQKSGMYAAQKIEVAPIKTEMAVPAEATPLLINDIHFVFEPNSAKLDMDNKINVTALDNFAQMLKVSPGSTILLRGHADPSLKEQYRRQGGESLVRSVGLKAMQLSKDRSDTVAKVLADKYKIDPARIATVGRGWEEPISDRPEENRRVEIQWFTVE